MIQGVEHHGNIPKTRGRLLKFIDSCSFWLMSIMLFCSIAIEIVFFALLYKTISMSSFAENLNYSLFSLIGEKAAASVQNSSVVNRIIPIQSVLTECIISFFMAIALYKLINLKPELIKMEDHLVFDPITGTLRLRTANISKFELTNVRIDASFRIHIPNEGRHANAKLELKTDNMSILHPYTAWNIATKPFSEKDGDKPQLDIKKYDGERIYKFIPDMLSKEFRSDDKQIAERLDYNNLNVIITIKSPLFGADWVYCKSFSAEDFVCGKLVSLDPGIPGKIITNWSNWEEYEDMSESYCEDCNFKEHCGIIKKSRRSEKKRLIKVINIKKLHINIMSDR